MINLLQPLVFAVYPVLFLYSRYTEEANNIFLYFSGSVAVGLVVIAGHYIYFSRDKTASPEYVRLRVIACSSLVILLLAIYGHAYNELFKIFLNFINDRKDNVHDQYIVLTTEIMVGLLWVVILFYALRFLSRAHLETLREVVKSLYIFGLLLIALPSVLIASSWVFPPEELEDLLEKSGVVLSIFEDDRPVVEACEQCNPDVYYIILDGYARADILDEFYSFNNEEFLNNLEAMDFAITENPRSNYFSTFLSLSSSLNMNYIEDVFEDFDVELDASSRIKFVVKEAIRNNLVSQEFKSLGYQYVHMASTWGLTRYNPYADVEYDCNVSDMQNDFDRVFVESTILRLLSDNVGMDLARCHLNNYHWLGELAPKIESPKFVFAHFVQPHHPYLFDKEGNILRYATLSDQFEFQKKLWGNRAAYIEQLQFVNSKVIEVVKNILKNSDRPPIVIIQSDHGPHLLDLSGNIDEKNFTNGRTGILLAVYTPDKQKVIPVKTPVNLFRYIFSQYTSTKIEPLPDRVFYSTYDKPYIFEEVTLD